MKINSFTTQYPSFGVNGLVLSDLLCEKGESQPLTAYMNASAPLELLNQARPLRANNFMKTRFEPRNLAISQEQAKELGDILNTHLSNGQTEMLFAEARNALTYLRKLDGIEAVCFDAGNVLLNKNFEKTRQKNTECYENLGYGARVSFGDFVRARREFCHEKANSNGLKNGGIQDADVVRHLNACFPELRMITDDYSEIFTSFYDEGKISRSLLSALSKKFKVGVLSNQEGQIVAKNVIQSLMNLYPELLVSKEDILVSSLIGAAKPSPDSFELFTEHFGISAEKILFVDDRLKNCNQSSSIGFLTLLYDPESPGVSEVPFIMDELVNRRWSDEISEILCRFAELDLDQNAKLAGLWSDAVMREALSPNRYTLPTYICEHLDMFSADEIAVIFKSTLIRIASAALDWNKIGKYLTPFEMKSLKLSSQVLRSLVDCVRKIISENSSVDLNELESLLSKYIDKKDLYLQQAEFLSQNSD